MDVRTIWVAMIPANGIEVGSFADMGQCFGAYADKETALLAVADHVREEIDDGDITLGWEMVDADEDRLVDAHTQEVHATVERIRLERRSAGDRRGTGR